MDDAQLLIGGLLVAVALLGALAQRLSLPYPIVLVLGGAVFGFAPGVPDVTLDPDVVLLIFLPPLLYVAASFSNPGEMRADLRSITMSAVGLVLVTMVAVAVIAHALIDGLSWEAAFALGAIVSPTDPLAGASIMRRLGVPRRLVTIAEGEGLLNDATALVAYKVAVVAVVSGSFSLADASFEFVAGAAGGIAIGWAAGWIIAFIRRRIDDVQVSITISLLSGYAAYIPAHEIDASGVLAAVTCGLYMGQRVARDLPARVRLQGTIVWEVLDFLLNAGLFVLVGLQLPIVLDGLDEYGSGELAVEAIAVAAAVIGARMAWLYTTPYVIRALDRRPGQVERRVDARSRLIIGWAGMRGAVSLAAALALPLTTDAGAAFPERDLLIFLTFAVIFATLVLQGLTLPMIIRWAGVDDGGHDERLELRARLAATTAALGHIDTLGDLDWTRDDSVERMRNQYLYRERRLRVRSGEIDEPEDLPLEDRSYNWQRMIQQVLGAQRDALVTLRDEGEIPNDVMNRVIRELDLEEARLEIQD